MSSSLGDAQLVILDACCIINLWATGRPEEILPQLPYRFAVARYVAEEEVLTFRSDIEDAGQVVVPAAIDLESEESGIEILEVSEGLEVDFVRFASLLDDGEAWTCAHALAESAWVGTDDRKALRILAEENPPVGTIETPRLIREWAKVAGVTRPELRRLLRCIETRAHFRPRRSSDLGAWWWKASS